MLTALTKDGSLIAAHEVGKDKLKPGPFYCPECRDQVIMKNGLYKKTHFAHKPQSQCFESYENESDVHLKGKLLLYEWLKKHYDNVQLETYLSAIEQRADLSFEQNGCLYVIEFQCSTIPLQIMQKRTNGYLKAGIRPLWILSHKQLRMMGHHLFSLNTFHYGFLQPTATKQLIIPFLNVETESLYVLHHLLPITTKKTFALLTLKPLQTNTLYELLNPELDRMSFSFWLKESEHMKRHGHLKYSSLSRRFKEELYQYGYHMSNLPTFCGLPVRGGIKLITAPIQWQTYIYLDVLKKELPFSLENIYDSMENRLIRKDIRLRDNVPIAITSVIDSYLKLLCALKVVEEIDFNNYQLSSRDKKLTKDEGEVIMFFALDES